MTELYTVYWIRNQSFVTGNIERSVDKLKHTLHNLEPTNNMTSARVAHSIISINQAG